MQFRHVYMNFRQNFSQKKNLLSPFQKKTLAETVHYIPKGLRKGNPFHGPFAQLSCRSNAFYTKLFGQFHIQVSYLEVRKNPVKKQVWT